MRRSIATFFFILLFPFAAIIIAARIVAEETWSALRSMYLEFRVEMSDLPVQWKKIRNL